MGLRNRSFFAKEGSVFFVTNTVMNWQNIFSLGDNYNLIILDSIKYLLKEHESELIAYVIMPSHLHLIPFMKKGESVSDLMRDLKKYTSTKMRKQLEADGHDIIVEHLKENAKGLKNQKFKLWMDRFDNVVIYSEKALRTKVNYIHNNPVKAGLVSNPEDWKYSSARDYFKDDHSIIEVNTSWDFKIE